mgnify:CR=1 FL=1
MTTGALEEANREKDDAHQEMNQAKRERDDVFRQLAEANAKIDALNDDLDSVDNNCPFGSDSPTIL